jgi:hypothetical protein
MVHTRTQQYARGPVRGVRQQGESKSATGCWHKPVGETDAGQQSQGVRHRSRKQNPLPSLEFPAARPDSGSGLDSRAVGLIGETAG